MTPRSWWKTSRRTTRVTGSRVRRTTIRSGCGWCKRPTLGRSGIQNLPIDELREHIGADLAADIRALLASGATFDGKPLRARDIAVIVERHKDAGACFKALCDAGIPAVYTGDSDVFTSEAAEDWLCLLEAFDQPHRPGMVHAAAATMFFGETAETLAAGGDPLTDRVAETLREWAGHARERGVAAIYEAAQLRGMGDRVLSWEDGERHMTDLAHMTQLLQDVAHRERLGLPGLRDWLRKQRDERSGATERNRRLDSDATAVQVMTVYAAKGLQFPVVYLPFAFNRNVQDRDIVLFHDDDGVRCLHIGGKDSPDFRAVERVGPRGGRQRRQPADLRRDDARPGAGGGVVVTGLRRAQRWPVPAAAWPSAWGSRCAGPVSAREDLRRRRDGPVARVGGRRRAGHRGVGGGRGATGPAQAGAVGPGQPPLPPQYRHRVATHLLLQSDPGGGGHRGHQRARGHRAGRRDRRYPVDRERIRSGRAVADGGSAVGREVRFAGARGPGDGRSRRADFAAELEAQARRHLAWWPVDVSAAELAGALVPMYDTSLGPLAGGLTLRQIGLRDRLREMDFEIPLAGGDVRGAVPNVSVSDVGELLRAHLPADDPLAPYADRLTSAALGGQSLRGYLTGSIDAVLRLPDQRYLVVDYKTNYLGDTAADYSHARLAEAMLHSDYPLQALLYTVVLHRFLRWRVSGYEPERHLGGVLYLFVRGMCGVDTPVVDGQPCGVFSWQPPAELVVALSDLLDAGRQAA